MEGTVKWFNARKGFGFVKGEDGEDYFVHLTALEKGTFLRDNDKVSFEPVSTEKGKQAQDVKMLQKASEMDQPEESQEEQEAPAEDSESFGEEENKE